MQPTKKFPKTNDVQLRKNSGYGKILTMHDLEQKTLKEIYNYAREYKISYYSQMNKKELSLAVLREQDKKRGFVQMEGVLEIISQEGYGFCGQLIMGLRRKIFIFLSRRFIALVFVTETMWLVKPGHRDLTNGITV